MSEFGIRRGKAEDAPMLSRIGQETFWATYGSSGHADRDDIRAYMARAYDEDLIRAELSEEAILYLVAEENDEPAGYSRLVIGSRTKDLSAERPIEISRIYLLSKFQGSGRGRKLIERCLGEAERLSRDVIWLSVWRHNQNAIGFYEKMGFRIEGTTEFDLAGTKHEDFMMAREVEIRQ